MRKALLVLALAAALAAGRPLWPLLASLWEESSCETRPGGCTVTPQTDSGFGMDPNGKPGS